MSVVNCDLLEGKCAMSGCALGDATGGRSDTGAHLALGDEFSAQGKDAACGYCER